jgi:hypothetical protein
MPVRDRVKTSASGETVSFPELQTRVRRLHDRRCVAYIFHLGPVSFWQNSAGSSSYHSFQMSQGRYRSASRPLVYRIICARAVMTSYRSL